MSHATREAMQEAIAAHYADETEGAIYSGEYLMVVNGTAVTQDRTKPVYLFCYDESTPPHVLLGLSAVLHGNVAPPTLDYPIGLRPRDEDDE